MPIQEHFLYTSMIEGDGKVRKELTFAGSLLAVIAGVAIAFAVGYILFVIVPVAFQ